MRAKCVVDPANGKLVPPSFEKGKGPIGSVALHSRNAQGAELFRIARSVMDAFIKDLTSRIFGIFSTAVGESWSERTVWFCPEEFFHTIVTVFMEAEEIVDDPEVQAKCRKVSDEERTELAETLKMGCKEVPPPHLRVIGYRITPDGAFLVLFEEDEAKDTEGASFTDLRQRTAQIGTEVLGELTSRPKNIVHATVGRVLEEPEDLTEAQRGALTGTVYIWAEALGEGKWPQGSENSGSALPGLGTVLTTDRIFMYQETGWWLTEFDEVEIPLKGE